MIVKLGDSSVIWKFWLISAWQATKRKVLFVPTRELYFYTYGSTGSGSCRQLSARDAIII